VLLFRFDVVLRPAPGLSGLLAVADWPLEDLRGLYTWIWPLLGLIFLPWTTLMYVIVFPVIGLDWLWLA
jgi:hypothetical protein